MGRPGARPSSASSSHYDAVVWYTGDDIITREPGLGRRQRLAARERRDAGAPRVPERGRQAALHGQVAPASRTASAATQLYDPVAQRAVRVRRRCRRCSTAAGAVRTRTTSSSTTSAPTSTTSTRASTPTAGSLRRDRRRRPVHRRAELGVQRRGQRRQPGTQANSFIATSGILTRSPSSRSSTSWAGGAGTTGPDGPFDPHTGDYYVYSQIADVSYKRLARTIDVPAGGGEMSFWTSYDTEPDWDYLFVEARHAGRRRLDDAPDLNGQHVNGHGRELPGGLERAASAARPLPDVDGVDAATRPARPVPGTPPPAPPAAGSSGASTSAAGAGEQVEISISYASDWSTQGLGVFVDDIDDVRPAWASTSFEDDADPMDGWTHVRAARRGARPTRTTWVRTDGGRLPRRAPSSSTPPDIDSYFWVRLRGHRRCG